MPTVDEARRELARRELARRESAQAGFTPEQQAAIGAAQDRRAQAVPDMNRIKRNVRKMLAQSAPEADIDAYIGSEGVSVDDVRAHDDMAPAKKGGLADFRRQYPQYGDMSDEALSNALYSKFYSDMPRDQFDAKMGGGQASHPTYEVETPHGAYEVQAPDEETAIRTAMGEGSAPSGALSNPNGILDQQQMNGLARAKALAAARNGGTPLALPPGHNAPEAPQVRSGGAEGIGAFAKSTVEGMPIVGPYLEKGTRAAAAGMLAPFSDRNFGEIYNDLGRGGSSAQFRNPNISTAGSVSGAVLGTAPMIMAAPGAFGAGAGSFGLRSAMSGVSGGVIGGADAAVRSGGDWEAIKRGATAGFGTGLVGPAAGQLVGAGMRGVRAGGTALSDALLGSRMVGNTGLSRRATDLIGRAAEADRLTPQALQQRMADLGPGAMLADTGPNLQQTASALVTMPGEARGIVQTAIRERDASATGRILSAMDENLGRASTPSRIEAGLDESKAALGPSYDDALEGAGPVNLSELAEGLDKQIMNLKGDPLKAAQKARAMLNVNGKKELETSPAAALQMRHALDDAFAAEKGSSTRSLLGDVRRQIDNELGRVAPAVKEVDAQFAELARQGEGLKRGGQVLDTGKTAIRPDELADEMLAGVQPQGRMVGPSGSTFQMREGARAELARIVGTSARDRAKLQSLIAGEGDWNPAKLKQVFGDERATRMLKVLDAEKVFADTANAVTQNSATAARQEGAKALEGIMDGGLGLGDSPAFGGVTGVILKGATKGADQIVKTLSKAGNAKTRAQVAGALVNPDPEEVVRALLARRRAPLTPAQIGQREALKRAILFGPSLAIAGR